MTGQLVFNVEIVTPVFLGGAQAGILAETIRPASIRGQLRYWLRAMLGASVHPTYPEALKLLKTREGYLLGNTDAGSPVRIRVRKSGSWQFVEAQHQLKGWATDGRMMLPHRAVVKQKNPLASDAFVENQRFDIILSPRPGRGQISDEIVAATLLWLYLGGLGKRARRGFGSLQPVACRAGEGVISDAARVLLPDGLPADTRALGARIGSLLSWMGGITILPAKAWVKPALPDYPILHEDVAGVRVSDPVRGYNLGGGYHEAMVPFWKESLRDPKLIDDDAYGYAKGNRRRASPFHLHIACSQEGYHQVFTTFWSKPLPDGDANWAKVGELLADVESKFGATNLWGRAK